MLYIFLLYHIMLCYTILSYIIWSMVILVQISMHLRGWLGVFGRSQPLAAGHQAEDELYSLHLAILHIMYIIYQYPLFT